MAHTVKHTVILSFTLSPRAFRVFLSTELISDIGARLGEKWGSTRMQGVCWGFVPPLLHALPTSQISSRRFQPICHLSFLGKEEKPTRWCSHVHLSLPPQEKYNSLLKQEWHSPKLSGKEHLSKGMTTPENFIPAESPHGGRLHREGIIFAFNRKHNWINLYQSLSLSC